jgi:hypothetical protein
MKKIIQLLLVIMLLAGSIQIVLPVSTQPVTASSSGNHKSIGDWLVTGYESYSNLTISITGDLTIKDCGHLVLKNCTINVMSLYLKPYTIQIEDNGTLELYDCYLSDTPNDNDEDALSAWYYLTAKPGSTLIIENSTVRQCGFMDSTNLDRLGLSVGTNKGHISNSTINQTPVALCLHGNNTGFRVENINVTQISMNAVFLFYSQGSVLDNITFMNNTEKRVMQAIGSSDFRIENITMTGQYYFGAMQSTGFTIKNIVSDYSNRLVDISQCSDFELNGFTIYDNDDYTAEIDISHSSNFLVKYFTVFGGQDAISSQENSYADFNNIKGYDASRVLWVQNSDHITIYDFSTENCSNPMITDNGIEIHIENVLFNDTSSPLSMTNIINSTFTDIDILNMKTGDYGGHGIEVIQGGNNLSFSSISMSTNSTDYTTGFYIENSDIKIQNYYSYNFNLSINSNQNDIYCKNVYVDGSELGDSGLVLFQPLSAYLSKIKVFNQSWNGIKIEKAVKPLIYLDDIFVKNSDAGIQVDAATGVTISDMNVENSDWNLSATSGSLVTVWNSSAGRIYADDAEINCINSTNSSTTLLSGSAKLFRKWWVDVFVEDSVGPIASATAKIYDKNTALEISSDTGIDGFARNIPVTDRIFTPPNSVDTKNPHKTNAEGPGWSAQNTTPYQVLSNMLVNVTYSGNAPPNQPTNLQIESDENSDTILMWTPSSSLDVVNYHIYIAKSVGDLLAFLNASTPNLTVTGNSYTHKGGSEDWVEFWYAVKANDSVNESVGSVIGSCGNWVINKTVPQYINNENITLNGGLLIYGDLELNDTNLKLKSDYSSVIFVNSSGNLKCDNVSIGPKGDGWYSFMIAQDAVVSINNSFVDKPGINKYGFDVEIWDRGIFSQTRNLTISNTIINVSCFGLGIYTTLDFNGKLYNVTFKTSTKIQEITEYLLFIYESSGVIVDDCNFGTQAMFGISVESSSEIEVTKSYINIDTGIDAYWGIFLTDCSDSRIADNELIKGRPAVYFTESYNISFESSKFDTHESYGIYGDNSHKTTIQNCEFDTNNGKPETSILMMNCQDSTIRDMFLVGQSESVGMINEVGSTIQNLTIDGGDVGIWLTDSRKIDIIDVQITLVYTGMTVTNCRDILLFNTIINLTFYCLITYSPGPIYILNCTIENGIGADITAEGFGGELGDVNLINSTINALSETSIVLNNSAVLSILNTSFDLTKLMILDFASRVEVYHYLSIQVYDIDNNIPAWANISIYNEKDILVYEKQVNAGYAELIIIHQKTVFQEEIYYDNPHRIYFYDGSHSGTLETDINATGHLDLYVSNVLPWISYIDIFGFYDIPSPGGIVKSYEPTTEFDINLTYMYKDQEKDPEQGTLIHWYVNGIHNSTFDNMLVIDDQYTTKHQTWKAMVYPSDGYDSTYPAFPFESNVVYIGNTAPVVSNVTISPSEPVGGDDLTVDYDFFDLDYDGLVSSKSSHKWYYYNLTIDDWVYSNIDSTTLSNSYTKKSQKWRCEVTPNDGDDDGQTGISIEVVIGNTAPEIKDAGITPEKPKSNESFSVDYIYYDLDNDIESSTMIKWFKNNVEQASLNGSIKIDPSLTEKGETWYYIITPFDGENYGISVKSETITVDNTAPQITNISILPANPTTAEDLTVTYDYYDADGDDESHETIVEWLVWSGVEFTHTGLRVKTLASSYTLKNEVWTCEITPHDSYVYGKTIRATVSVTVDNSIPTVSDYYITPISPTTKDPLIANYDYADLDNELENGTEIQWYRDEMLVPELNNLITVNQNYTQKGQTWYFRIRPRDGFEFGAEGQSESITVQNGAPSASNLTINPRFPLGDDDLKASYLFTDPDGDNESAPEIRWYRNGLLQGFYNDMTEVESTASEKGDLWYFTLRVSDGIDFGEELSSHYVIIENSKPVLISLSPDPGNLIVNETDSLEFLAGAYDPDGDTLLFKWRLDKSTVSDSEYFEFETDYDSKGTYELNLSIQDVGKNSFNLFYLWQITVQNSNRIPEIEVEEPLVKNPRVKEDSTIKFGISVEELDTDDNIDITWYLDGIAIPDEYSKTLNFRATHANIGHREIKVEVTDSYSTVDYVWNLTVEEQIEELGPLGVEWDVWGILLEVIVLLATGILAFIGYRRLSKKKGALKVYMDKIEEISKMKDKDPEKYESELSELEEKISAEFKEGKLEDLHYLMLQELIATKRGEGRRASVSKKFQSLPKGIADNLDEMLKDGKITKEEYQTFVLMMQKSKTLTPYEKKELSKIVSRWEVEDTGVSTDDALAQKIKIRKKVELDEWDEE